MIAEGLLLSLALLLPSATPEELELQGRLWEAGAAYEEEGNLHGGMRIRCRLLENALYAGHPFRAARLIDELEHMGADPSEVRLWRARLAWVCGLSQLALQELLELEGPDWTGRRAAGLHSLYRRRADDAVEQLAEAYSLAGSDLQRYYVAVDLTYALLSAGSTARALEAADSLVAAMPADGLPSVLRCLCLQRQGRYAECMTALDSLATDSAVGIGPGSMARDLLEELQ
jgi:hypothetical protein